MSGFLFACLILAQPCCRPRRLPAGYKLDQLRLGN